MFAIGEHFCPACKIEFFKTGGGFLWGEFGGETAGVFRIAFHGGNRFARSIAFHDAHVEDVWMLRDACGHALVDFVIGLHNGVSELAFSFAEQLCGGDIHVEYRKACCDVRENARHVALLHDDAVIFARQANVDAVDARDDRCASANALSTHGNMRTRGIGDFDAYGVGVGHRLVRTRLECETQVLLFGDFE